MHENLLLKAGLTDNQVRIYDLLLRKGPATAAELTEVTKMQRGSVYYVLDSLIAEELIEKTKRGAKTLFQAAHPTVLMEYINRKKKYN